MKTIKNNRGLTLIELMIVIGMLGILAGIALPNFLAYKENSKIRLSASELRKAAKYFQTVIEFPRTPRRGGIPKDLVGIIPKTLPLEGAICGYNGVDGDPYIGITIGGLTTKRMERLALALGSSLSSGTGPLIKTPNGGYLFIVKQ